MFHERCSGVRRSTTERRQEEAGEDAREDWLNGDAEFLEPLKA